MITQDLVRRVRETLRTSADVRYFFDRLTSPDWIVPLDAEGFFDSPPAPVVSDEGVLFPAWPASRYLARVAGEAADRVIAVLEKLSPENERVREDIVVAAIAMPAAAAVRIAPRAMEWAVSPRLLMPDRLANLAVHLARGGFRPEATALMRELLAVEAEARSVQLEAETISLPPRPKTRIAEWDFSEIVKRQLREMVEAIGVDGLRVTLDVLESVILASRPHAEEVAPEDYLWVSRPAIESHQQNMSSGVEGTLIEAARDSAESLSGLDEARLREVIAELNSRRWVVFWRLGLHLANTHAALVPDVVAEYLARQDLVYLDGSFHEFWKLARDQFPLMTPEQAEDLLRAIGDGPPDEAWQDREDRDELVRGWKYRRLSILEEHLPGPWRDEFARLQREFGIVEHPEFRIWSSGVMRGDRSPIEPERLASMEIPQLIDYLTTWEPSETFLGPSRAGLGSELEVVVAQEPTRFASSAMRFRDVDPDYVRSILQGLGRAAADGKPFSWQDVLRLCQWVVSQPPLEGAEARRDLDERRDWKWTRQSITRLFDSGFAAGDTQIPFELRGEVWEVLEQMAEDPNPSREDDDQAIELQHDPAMTSINTVRGLALHSVVRYALWAKRNAAARWSGIVDLPEVRAALERHLDPGVDPSPAIRSVYGQWLPWLMGLDEHWASALISDIFPGSPELAHLRDAAWNTYVSMSPAVDNVYRATRGEYEAAVGRLHAGDEAKVSWKPVQDSLGEHLMVFYLRGLVGLEPQDLVRTFFAQAEVGLRRKTLSFVGRVLERDPNPIPDALVARARALYEFRLQEVSASPDEGDHDELAAFGFWFGLDAFAPEWALGRLIDGLRVWPAVDDSSDVLGRLSDLSEAHVDQVATALDLMVRGDVKGWDVLAWHQKIYAILEIVLESDHDETRRRAEELTDLLVARGYDRFAELLRARPRGG